MNEVFRKSAHWVSNAMGNPWTFMLAFFVIVLWLVTGPLFGYSDTWQLVINTATTIVTFLMVFLIQNTQNREARAINLKLDELLRVMRAARNDLIDLENMSDEQLDSIEEQFKKLVAKRPTKKVA
ncbi:MAG: low affinity iron permease family protein [Candidatus Dojkabacteria bacterium]|nr:MAG: low affinity iron permease family protein [Candidatus Dojkabacteria bacterium]